MLKLQREGKVASLSEFLRISEERTYSKAGKGESSSAKYIQKAGKFFSVSLDR